MNINEITCLISTICVLALFQAAQASEYVPVCMWGSSKSNEIVPAVAQINQATFTEILFEKIKKNNPKIVVFAEQNLSPEDFIEQIKKSFEHISAIAARKELTYLPLVEDPVETIKDLPAKDIAEISISEISSAKDFPDSQIVIVDLNDAEDDEDRTDMLARHDATIHELYKELVKEHPNILVLFTGFHSSWIVPDQIKNHRESRSVSDSNETMSTKEVVIDGPRVLLKNEDLMVFVNNTVQLLTKGENEEFTVEYYKLMDLTGKAENGTEETVFTLKTNSTKDFQLTFKSTESGYWYLMKITFNGNDYGTEKVYAPRHFSFHCDNGMYPSINETDSYLKFEGFQIQYGLRDYEEAQFQDAYDCVGFTTAPIWSGLFVTFILALIMTLGLTMMMDIKTMDRFDDPKGKTIIINAAE